MSSLDNLVEIAARALLDHHFPGKTPSDGALERARIDARIVIAAIRRAAVLTEEDDLK